MRPAKKIYEVNTVVTFGKHARKTIGKIWAESPSYIEWCLINVEHFTITERVYSDLNKIRNFTLDEYAMKKVTR